MCFFKKRKQRKEAERLAAEQAEKERLEQERLAKEKAEKEAEEKEKKSASKAKKETKKEEVIEEVEVVEETEQASEETAETAEKKVRKAVYRVVFDKEESLWEIKKDGAKRIIASYKTKQEALDKVQNLSKNQEINFVVMKKDGKFQKKANLKLKSDKKED